MQHLYSVLTALALFIFGILMIHVVILVHEMGHLLAARLLDMPVMELCVGVGPRLVSFRFNNISYVWRPIPLFGYVRVPGLLSEQDPMDVKYLVPLQPAELFDLLDRSRWYCNKGALQQIIFALAGVAANFVLAPLLLVLIYAASPSLPVPVALVRDNASGERTLILARRGNNLVKPRTLNAGSPPETDLLVRQVRIESGEAIVSESHGRIEAKVKDWDARGAPVKTLALTGLSTGIEIASGGELRRFHFPPGNSGPFTDLWNAAHLGPRFVLLIVLFLNLGIMFFNLIPVPPLDGGRAFLSVIALVTRKRVHASVVQWVSVVGAVLLLLLMLWQVIGDVGEVIGGLFR